MADSIKEIIKRSELFWNLSDEQVEELAYLAVQQSFSAGQRVITEGEPLPNFYIVVKGKVALEMEIRIGSRTRRRAVIDVIQENGFLGWSEFLNLPASMSGTAIEDSQLLAFDGNLVRKLCRKDTGLGYKVTLELLRLASRRFLHTRRTLAHVLAVTSHDLRAPLATAVSTLDVVLGGFAGEINSKQKELLSGGKQRIIDLLKMIDNILDISYIEIKGADFVKVDLGRVGALAVGDVEGMARHKGINLENRISKELTSVLGMPTRLQQVLTNLLSNGVKFTPVGGKVTLHSKETGDKVQIDVADTGIGVPEEEQPKIFSDFYRGKKVEEEGAGLGLAIAKKIIEAHGGGIWLASPDPETGKGTRFSFALPKVLPVARVPKEPEMGEHRTQTGADILVVDDDPEMRPALTAILESQGYRVRTAQDGQEGLEKIQEKEPDLLLLDLLMPRVDGFEVCKQLQRKKAAGSMGFPVIILSAVFEENSRRRDELETETKLEVDGYITKPVSPPILIQQVRKALSKPAAKAAMTKGDKQ